MIKIVLKLIGKVIFVLGPVVLCLTCSAQDKVFNLIPQPTHLEKGEGAFILKANTAIVPASVSDKGLAELLALRLKSLTGYDLKVAGTSANSNVIRFVSDANVKGGKEAYQLEVTSKAVVIKANQPEGWFYAMQTLVQLLPLKAERAGVNLGTRIPAVKIEDAPRFQWRGLMVDVSRHFFSKEVIKRYILQMSKYKMNVLHLHLTDNQGWRVEIKSLPKLTEVGAWRVPRKGYWRNQKAPEPGEQATDGGFYTQDDIRELVAYGQQYFVELVPEIDVPGHSLALIAAYPELSCTKKSQQVLAGDPWNASRTNVVCAGNDSVFVFLEKVIGELAGLFPSKYIHIGGDEVSRAYWDKCPVCQQRIKDEHLKSSEELQSYFLKRVSKIVLSKGKKPLGWYENLPGGLPDEMAVMSWKDDKGGILSSKKGQQVVMTPAAYTYLDFYQGDQYLENAIFTVNRLNTTFLFDPLPKGIEEKNVMGGQGSLWTEQVPNERKLQFMTWPRAFALSETLWSGAGKSSWTDFISRVESHLPMLDRDTVNYSRYFYDAVVSGVRGADKALLVNLTTEIEGLKIYYSFDDTDPDPYYPVYAGRPLDIPKGAQNIRVVTYRNGIQVGRLMRIPIAELERRTPAK
ncbi:MAG: family 20 glycosylhydrolase [Candidatus Pedobacter colombiensis]|uniref:beta-N-acetylhexosaminidase n=1 Tax=Candidatus Pedobacter colombiensis TaxID=3121371 RepID=A0AAJ5W5Q4_9SPHI|nr:family 20 glycosylhydrolase [Pedobacter sp.]WEK18065.1 MAG: family 20 glycosylhydrolase [Pedobacter sp.]